MRRLAARLSLAAALSTASAAQPAPMVPGGGDPMTPTGSGTWVSAPPTTCSAHKLAFNDPCNLLFIGAGQP